MYVIAGVTGHVGQVAANELLERGKSLRVIVRSEGKGAAWRARGADVAVGELGDVAFLTGALRGAEAAFLLLPPPVPPPASAAAFLDYQKQLGASIAEAVKASGVPHVVFLSSIGAHLADGTGPIKGLYHAERALAATGAKVTNVRACSFMENLAGLAGAIVGMGMLPNFVSEDFAMSHVATRDIGHVVAGALLDPPAESRVIELAGPVDLTAAAVAGVFGAALGRTISLMTVPEPGVIGAMLGAGMPQTLAEVYAEMYVGLNSGHLDFESRATIRRGSTQLAEIAPSLLGQ